MKNLKSKIAAQMYSVRKEFAEDAEGTLRRLQEIGYEAIQLDGMRGNDPIKVASLLKKYNFKVAGMHIKHERFFHDVDGIIEEAYLFGCKTVYDKYIDDDDQTEQGYRKTKAALLEAASKLSSLGFRVGLHNPEYDYNNKIDGRKVIDFITDPVNDVCIYPEPDTYWMTIAGEDPVESIKKYSGRAPILHLKDYQSGYDLNDMENNLAEVGSGEIDMRSVVKWGEENGVEYYCVEQDYSKIGIFESLKRGFDYLVSLEKEL